MALTSDDAFGDILTIVSDVANDTSHPVTLHQTANGAILSFAPGLSLKSYWIAFMRTGDPNGARLANWPKFTAQEKQHVLFDAKGVTIEGPLRPQLCALDDRL